MNKRNFEQWLIFVFRFIIWKDYRHLKTALQTAVHNEEIFDMAARALALLSICDCARSCILKFKSPRESVVTSCSRPLERVA